MLYKSGNAPTFHVVAGDVGFVGPLLGRGVERPPSVDRAGSALCLEEHVS